MILGYNSFYDLIMTAIQVVLGIIAGVIMERERNKEQTRK